MYSRPLRNTLRRAAAILAKSMMWTGWGILVVMLGVSLAGGVSAGTVPVEEMAFDVAASLKDNLRSLAGKDVYVALRSGKVYRGYVKFPGAVSFILKSWQGKTSTAPSSAWTI